MRPFVTFLIAASMPFAVALTTAPLRAGELNDTQAKAMFNDKGCNACHAVDETRIGPAYRDIATRYADDRVAAEDRLSVKIRYGGAGAWGIVPMISNPGVSADEAGELARWILSLPPAE